MKRVASLACTMLILAARIAGAAPGTNHSTGNTPAKDALFIAVSKLDGDLFDALNHCASPNQLQKHASYFAPNVEFYDDMGGVSWSRRDYIAKIKNHVCGQFRRELIPGTLRVFSVRDYGAIEEGNQNFCWLKSGMCFGTAQYFILWHHLDSRWVITRIFSYGHRPIEPSLGSHKPG